MANDISKLCEKKSDKARAEAESAFKALSLDDLLSGCTSENMRLNDEDCRWLNDKPVGKEIL